MGGDLPGANRGHDLAHGDPLHGDRGGLGRAGLDRPSTATLTPFMDALRVPPVIRPRGPRLTVEMRSVDRRLHSQLPPTRLWTYGGHFPGPTIEVRRGQRLEVAWKNDIEDERVPVTAVEVFAPVGIQPNPYVVPGRSGGTPRADVAVIPPWLVVHLHGAVTGAGQDGWSENGQFPGETQIVEYLNDQPAATLWYHDHSMHISTWTLFAGLIGMYLIRDEQEDLLGLPDGGREIPLVITDRNFEVDPDGRLTGGLLHKVTYAEAGPPKITAGFRGPYTLVNGMVWPYLDVEPGWYRFRLLNACNTRTYHMMIIDEETGRPMPGTIRQIGTDAGLLPAPVTVDSPLILSPGERADILVDFTGCGGRRLRLVNVLDDNPPAPPISRESTPGLPYPEMMQFRVAYGGGSDLFVPPPALSPTFTRTTYDSLPADRNHRIVLTKVLGGRHAEMWEMEEVDAASVTIPSDGVVQLRGADGRVRTFRRISRDPDDTVNFYGELGKCEHWTFINAATALHPMHIHLMRFQILSREEYDVGGFDMKLCGTTRPLAFKRTGVVQEGEKGWKDVVRLGDAEVVEIAGRFEGGTGRYAYHCHLLEHQDTGMMRPLIVFPPGVGALRLAHQHTA
ncbi:multicopper oxidase domain-containing protein [Microtetraspora sp. AC03309]|nr:multicopper oxidase domain-containing protein [Microtetraspora sp. AC03309]